MSEFFHMGGFGAYIWSAMAVALVLMLLEPLVLILKKRSVITQIKRNQRLEQRRVNKRSFKNT